MNISPKRLHLIKNIYLDRSLQRLSFGVNLLIVLIIIVSTACGSGLVLQPQEKAQSKAQQNRRYQPMNEEEKKNLLEALHKVWKGTETMHQSRVYIHEAGESQDLNFISILKRIASQFSKTDKNSLIFDSLHAQSNLGEGTHYFLQLAHNHKVDKETAYYAILILARQPNKSLLAALDQIREQSSNNYIRGAVDLARYVAYQNEQLEQIQDIDSKFDFLIENLKDGWNSIQIEEYSPRGNLSPIAVWSQRELYKLSIKYPPKVAQMVFKMGASPDPKGLTLEYKNYVARFIGESADVELKKLEDRAR